MDEAYTAGVIVGRIIGLLLVIGIPVGIVYGIVKLVKRRNNKNKEEK